MVEHPKTQEVRGSTPLSYIWVHEWLLFYYNSFNHLSIVCISPIAPKISAYSSPGKVPDWKGSDGGATGVRVRHRQTPGGMPRARLARQGGLVGGHAQSTTIKLPAANPEGQPSTGRLTHRATGKPLPNGRVGGEAADIL